MSIWYIKMSTRLDTFKNLHSGKFFHIISEKHCQSILFSHYDKNYNAVVEVVINDVPYNNCYVSIMDSGIDMVLDTKAPIYSYERLSGVVTINRSFVYKIIMLCDNSSELAKLKLRI